MNWLKVWAFICAARMCNDPVSQMFDLLGFFESNHLFADTALIFDSTLIAQRAVSSAVCGEIYASSS